MKNLPGLFNLAVSFAFVFLLGFAERATCSSEQALLVEPASKETTLSGYTRSISNMTISSEVAGKVLKVNYEVGDVAGEEPLVELDPTFIDFEIQGARHSLRLLENSRHKAEERLAYLEKEFRRIDALHKGDRATEVKRDEAEQLFIQGGFEKEAVAIEIGKLKNAIDELLERKSRYRIHAPKGWIIVGKTVEPGEQVLPGAPLARASDFRTLVVPLSVSGDELEQLRTLPAKFPAFLERKPVSASIRWVNPEFDEKTRKLAIQLVLPDYDGEKRGGLEFSTALKLPSAGIQVPREAVVSRYENPRVTIESSGEKINVLVIGESDGRLLIADHPKLQPGTELARPESP
jgi:multidrug efflux pump subunit AcrA (membrane-fusion protein)